ncbi:adenosine receptor A3-like [Clavelina lepadiformis]|uniref:adenosine receptor A3-like n=1 Tax=Clavelina lepadiformis TaxID=159417 RepID=UPI004042FCF0
MSNRGAVSVWNAGGEEISTIDVSSLLRNETNKSENSVCFNFDNSLQAIVSQMSVAITIIILNSMVVAIINRASKNTFRKPAFVFITCLATSDLLLAIALVGYSIISIGQFQLSASAWVILTASTSVCFNSSTSFLLVIAFDRLCFIGYHRKYSNIMTRRNIAFLIFLSWVFAFIPAIPLFSDHGSCADSCMCVDGSRLSCPGPRCSTVIVGFTKVYLFGLFFYFLVMFASISLLYAILFWKVRHQANRVKTHLKQGSVRSRSHMSREFKLARTLGIVVMTFFICWSPLMLLYLIDYVSGDDFHVSTEVVFAVMSPAMMNSMMNPIIYAARIPLMKKYFCPCARKTDEHNSDQSTSRRNSSAGTARNIIFKLKQTKKPSGTIVKADYPSRDSQHSFGTSTLSEIEVGSASRHNSSANILGNVSKALHRLRSGSSRSAQTSNKAAQASEDGKATEANFLPLNPDISISRSVHNSFVDEIEMDSQVDNECL